MALCSFASLCISWQERYSVITEVQFSSVIGTLLLFSGSAVSNSLWPQGLQHAGLPCPLPSPRACSSSWPSSRWRHPAILSSVAPFSSCLQFFYHQSLYFFINYIHVALLLVKYQYIIKFIVNDNWNYLNNWRSNLKIILAGFLPDLIILFRFLNEGRLMKKRLICFLVWFCVCLCYLHFAFPLPLKAIIWGLCLVIHKCT